MGTDNITEILLSYNYSYSDNDRNGNDCDSARDTGTASSTNTETDSNVNPNNNNNVCNTNELVNEKIVRYNETNGVISIKWPIYPLAKIPETNETVLTVSMLSTHGRYFDLWDESSHYGIKYNFRKLSYNERPYHSYWGNGDEFSKQEINLLTKIFDNNVIDVKLIKGDLILIDNLKYVHGRTSYVDATTNPELTTIKRKMGAVMLGRYDRKFWTNES